MAASREGPVPGEVRSLEREEGATVKSGDAVADIGADKNHVWEALRALYIVGQRADLEAVQRFTRPVPGFPDTVARQAALTAQRRLGLDHLANLALDVARRRDFAFERLGREIGPGRREARVEGRHFARAQP